MGLLVVAPAAPLSSLVASLWDCDLPRQPHGFDRLLPSARAQLVINLDEDESRVYDEALRCTRNAGAALDAPSSRSCLIDTAEQVRVVGVVFRAGAAAPFFRQRTDAIADGHQAHLVHEFRAFSGMTPTAWMARRGEWQRHVALP